MNKSGNEDKDKGKAQKVDENPSKVAYIDDCENKCPDGKYLHNSEGKAIGFTSVLSMIMQIWMKIMSKCWWRARGEGKVEEDDHEEEEVHYDPEDDYHYDTTQEI